MANDNTREVALNLTVATQGAEAVPEIGKDLQNLGKQASSATPELDALADEGARLTAELEAAATATKTFREAEATAKTEVRNARRELDDKRDALERLKIETDRATKKTAEWQQRERELRIEVADANKAVRQKREALETAADATRRAVTAEAELGTRLAVVNTQQREATLAAVALGRSQAAGAEQTAQAAATMREGLQGVAGQLRSIQQLAGAVLGGQILSGMIGDVARTADAYSNLQARMRLVVGEGDALTSALNGVVGVATRTGSELEGVATLFTRLAQAGKDAGLGSQQAAQQALSLTESIGQAVQISSASAQASEAAITQLIQGLQSGVLRGEELNAQLENAPRLARALADGLGVTTGELRKLGEAGQLTSQVVITALQGQSATLQAEFDKLPPTVGRALTNLSTQWTAYLGQVDQANGVSVTAARAINALASNLDTVAGALFSAGKAVAAYQALRLGQTLLEAAAGARASAAAIAVETAAVQANTAAKVANNAAAAGVAEGLAGAAASAGRFAAIASTLKTFSLVGILTNAREIGTWLGETAAKLTGVKDRTAELEAAERAAADAAREQAQSMAALAQQHLLAENRALGLTTQARAMVAQFEQARIKGDSAAEAISELGKAFDLSSLQGIKDAGAALDALALKGQITGQQVREALARGLDGKDLAVFHTTAQAAFDGTTRGAERLAAAIDAIGAEALRRAGSSVQELQTGFSAAMNSAINDTDALTATIERLGTKGPEVGRLLAGSLDRTLDAANTQRAVQAVIDRWQALGAQGLVTGQQLAQGLEQARAKLDEIRPGVNSLDEALRTFGLKTRAELQTTADTYRAAWQQISTSTTVSLADKARAFTAYKEAAIAANNGVVTAQVMEQEAIFKTQLTATSAGEAIAAAMGLAGSATDRTTAKVGQLNEQLNRAAALIPASGIADTPDKNPTPFSGAQPDYSTRNDLVAKYRAGTLTADDAEAAAANLQAAKANQKAFGSVAGSKGFSESTQMAQAIVDAIKAKVVTKTVNVNLKVGGNTTTVGTSSEEDAAKLVSVLRVLEQASGRS